MGSRLFRGDELAWALSALCWQGIEPAFGLNHGDEGAPPELAGVEPTSLQFRIDSRPADACPTAEVVN